MSLSALRLTEDIWSLRTVESKEIFLYCKAESWYNVRESKEQCIDTENRLTGACSRSVGFEGGYIGRKPASERPRSGREMYCEMFDMV